MTIPSSSPSPLGSGKLISSVAVSNLRDERKTRTKFLVLFFFFSFFVFRHDRNIPPFLAPLEILAVFVRSFVRFDNS